MSVIEVVVTSVFAGCFAYLTSEINSLQIEVKRLTTKVAVIEAVAHSRRSTDRDKNP